MNTDIKRQVYLDGQIFISNQIRQLAHGQGLYLHIPMWDNDNIDLIENRDHTVVISTISNSINICVKHEWLMLHKEYFPIYRSLLANAVAALKAK